MIRGAKDMIASCIERMRQDGCGGCERRDACASLMKSLRFGRVRQRRRPDFEAPSMAMFREPLLAFLGKVTEAVEAGRPQQSPFRREVERTAEPLLSAGNFGMERVARELGCSRQTLYRRLKAEGVTFEKLLDDLRRRLAPELVRTVPVKQAAWRLGFADPASFSRAFKRWTGRSPSEARAGRQAPRTA